MLKFHVDKSLKKLLARNQQRPYLLRSRRFGVWYRAEPTHSQMLLNVVTPFHHLSGDSHINRSLRAVPITALNICCCRAKVTASIFQ